MISPATPSRKSAKFPASGIATALATLLLRAEPRVRRSRHDNRQKT
jgi:hypothetical protein